jgi:hypothetical protein
MTFVRTIFIVAWTVWGASSFLTVIEGLLVWRFVPLAYAVGIRVLDQAVNLPQPALPRDFIGETATGKFKLSQSDACLFRLTFRFLDFHIHTPFPIQGVLPCEASGSRVIGRIPLGPTVFLEPGCWDGQ